MLFRKYLFVVLAVNTFSLPSYGSEEELDPVEEPDFYSTTGLDENRSYDNSENIYIDTFSGTMQAHYTDMVVPGVGGLDIAIQRSYSSSLTDFNAKTYMGSRWSISFGGLKNSYFVCDEETGDVGFSGARGSFVKPDGSVEPLLARNTLFIDKNGDGTHDPISEYKPNLITPSLWRVKCEQDNLVLTDTNGTSYYIGDYDIGWRVVKVEDVNGNYYEIKYEIGDFEVRPKEVITSDGRRVEFNYKGASFENDDGDYNATVLDSIRYKDLIVKYNIELVNPYVTKLKEVIRPDGSFWEYGYNDVEVDTQGQGQIKRIVNPVGLETTFKYENLNHLSNEYPVIKQKCVDTSCWDYSYSRAKVYKQNERDYDITTITGPDGVKQYEHYGLYSADRSSYYDNDREILITNTSVWQIGLLKKMTHTYAGETVLQEENTWGSFVLAGVGRGFSIENGASVSEPVYRKPVLTGRRVVQDQSIYDYEVVKMNKVGWPELVKETGTDTIYKKTVYALIGDKEGPWVLELPYITSTGESQDDLKKVSFNEYNEVGQVVKAIDKGVVQEYDYYSNGNLKIHKDGEGNITEYSDYNYGVARRVDYPGGGFQTKTVDHHGRTKSVTNSYNITTYYDHDEIGRLIYIDNPISEDVTIEYFDNGKTVVHTRGSIRQTNSYNSKMLLLDKKVEDLVTGKVFVEKYDYDDLDRLEFKSRVNDEESGVTYKYDPSNRLTKTETTDGRSTLVDYVDGETRKVTNARGFVTTYTYKTYSPTTKLVEKVEGPENVVIETEYNELGQPLSISQNGVVREYGYNDHWQLNYYKEPEKDGHMTYVYDLTGRTKEAIHYIGPDEFYTTFYEYDKMGRLKETTYPLYFHPLDKPLEPSYKNACQVTHEVTCDFALNTVKVINHYDLLGQLKRKTRELITEVNEIKPWFRQYEYTKSNAWIYDYDDEGRLREESFVKSVEEDSEIYTFSYGYNQLDHLTNITYPTGNIVSYSPDVFGRPTQAGSFVTSVEYYDSGSIKKMVYGNGQVTNYTLNDQLLPETMAVGKANNNLVSFTYDYDNMGNLNSIINELDSSKSVGMTYDGLDRLLTANGSWGVGNFDYDELGNIKNKTIGPVTMFYSYDERNRLDNFSGYDYGYDIAGRVSNDEKRRYFCDHANNLINATSLEENGSIVSMDYDGNNRLIERKYIKAPGATPDIKSLLYTQAGKLMHEVRSSGDFKRDHVYLGNKLVGYFDDAVDCMADFDGDGIPHCYERENGLDPYSDDADLDKDGDGLTNLEEYQLGTRADISDTDGDGIPDGFEVAHGLNPLVDDADLDNDGDGFSNYDEYISGLDPSVFNAIPQISNIAAAGDKENIVIAWEPSHLVNQYKLYWSETPNFDVNTSNTIELTEGLYYHKVPAKGKKYYYKAVAYNSKQQTEPSAEVSAVSGRHGLTEVAEVENRPRASAVDLHGNVHAVYFDNDSASQVSNVVIKYFAQQSVTTDEFVLNDTYNKVELVATAQGYLFAIFTGDNYYIKVYNPVTKSWHEHDHSGESEPGDVLRIPLWSHHDNGNFAYVEQKWRQNHGYQVNHISQVFRFIPGMGWSDGYSLAYTKEESEFFEKGEYDFYAEDISINKHGNVAVTWPKDVSHESSNEESDYAIKGFDSLHLAIIDSDGNINKTFIDDTKRSEGASDLWFDDNNSGQIIWRRIEDDNIESALFSQKFTLEGLTGEKLTIDSRQSERYNGFKVQLLPTKDTLLFLDEQDHTKVYLQQQQAWSSPYLLDYSIMWSRSGFYKSNNGWPQLLLVDYDYDTHHLTFTAESGFHEIELITENRKFSNITVAGQLAQWMYVPAVTEYDPALDDYVEVTPDVFKLYVRNVTELSAVNTPPVADAGMDSVADEFTTIELDAGMSTDSDGYIADYYWQIVSGEYVAELIDPASPKPEVKLSPVDADTEVKFQLTVTDNAGATSTDDVLITIKDTGNIAPVADAGQDSSVTEGETVFLGLNDSYDPDGNGYLSYSWGTISGGYLPIEQAPDGGLQFIAPQVSSDRTYTLRLTVTDPEGASSSDTVQITVLDNGSAVAPIADAGEDQTHPGGEFVILDGTNSSDPDGGQLQMSWSVVSGGELTFQSSPNPGLVGFQAPEVEQTTEYVLRLTVTNSAGLSATDDVIVTILGSGGPGDNPGNLPPVADAGLDQTANEGTVVILDGRNSYDPDGGPLSLSWNILSGGSLALEQGPEPGTLQFTAPNITPSQDYVLELKVTDAEGATGTDEVTITIIDLDGGPNNIPPVADAGVDQVVNSGDTVIIDPRYSYDPDGYSLSLGLSIIAGGYLPLENGPEPGTFKFVAPDVSSQKVYTLRITVTDADGASDSDDINVTVMPR